jgi:hypothetical protein
MQMDLVQPESAMNGPFMGRPLVEELPIKVDHNNAIDNFLIDPGFSFSPLPMRPGSEFLQPIIGGGGGGIGQYLQPMIRHINSHYQQNEVQPFVQEVTSMANERFPNAFGGGGMLNGVGQLFQHQPRPMPTQDIFSGVSGAALGLLAAR